MYPSTINGMPVILNSYLFTELRQIRKHRQKRINKKWRKRYGVTGAPDPSLYIVDGKIICHPDTFQKMQIAIEAREEMEKSGNAWLHSLYEKNKDYMEYEPHIPYSDKNSLSLDDLKSAMKNFERNLGYVSSTNYFLNYIVKDDRNDLAQV
jgi:hypothetical protein